MKKSVALPFLGLALAAAAGGGWYWWTELRFLESTDNAYGHADLSPVGPKVAGYVATVEVAENQPVRRGDVLPRLDDRDLRARVDQAAATLKAKAAAVATAESQLKLQDARVREAESTLASARAQAARAQADFRRYDKLAERKNASVQALHAARAESERAAATIAAAEAALDAAHDELAVLEAQPDP